MREHFARNWGIHWLEQIAIAATEAAMGVKKRRASYNPAALLDLQNLTRGLDQEQREPIYALAGQSTVHAKSFNLVFMSLQDGLCVCLCALCTNEVS